MLHQKTIVLETMSGDDLNNSLIQSALRRREYKQLLEIGGRTAENCDTNSVVENLSALKQLLVKSNELIGQGDLADRVGQSAEVVLDAQVCKLAGDLMGTTVQKIENDDFSDDVFAAALLEYVHCDETNVSDWSKLDGTVAKMSKTFSYTPSMFGTFDFDNLPDDTQATQKQRKTRRKAEPTEEKRPTSLQESSSTNSGTSKVEAVLNIIKDVYAKNGGKPIPYYQLIIDPSNMMFTFDNSFQISFLFRDGMIGFLKDDEGLPAIKPIGDPKPPKPSETTSFTSTLNHRIIQKYIKKYNIREPMLKIARD